MKILLTFGEAADYISLSESKIRRLINEGRMPAPIRIDGNVRWLAKDLDNWVEKLAAGEIPPSKVKRGRPRLAI